MLRDVPEHLMFPVLWFEQRASLPASLATPLRLLLLLPKALVAAAALLLLVGAGCLCAALRSRRRRLPPR